MAKKTQTLEEALLQIKNIEDAMKQNAKGILESTMKQELKDLLKEEEEIIPEEEVEEDMPEELMNKPKVEVDEQEFGDEEDDEENDTEDLDNTDFEDEDEDEEEVEDEPEIGDEMDADEFGDDEDMESDEDVFDMTNASDEEVLKVFKAMGPEDGIVVKKDGNKIKVDTGDDEFIIDLGGEGAAEEEEDEFGDDEFGDESEEDETDVDNNFGNDDTEDEVEEPIAEAKDGVLEIELDEECDEDLEECDKVAEEDVDEAARTKWNPHGDKGPSNRAGLKSKKIFKAGSGNTAVNEGYKKQYEALKKQNNEYKKALGLFRVKLNEVAVFNANLAYATRLFTEHSTTKQEKMSILERFDSVSTMDDSKKTYVSIKRELGSKQSVTENVAQRISKSPSSSSSKEMLEESKAYENPQFKRMKDLMKKLK